MKRTSYCGTLRQAQMGTRQTVMGWVQNKRDMGGVIFIDLKDREGTLQVVFNLQNLPAQEFALAEGLRLQSVIAACGPICKRDEETYNEKLQTGTIELRAEHVELLSQARPLPFSLEEGDKVREEKRLQYRYLDLRRPQMLQNLKMRHRVQKCAEQFLDEAGFISIETPMLTKSTPEGARDYLVPSRVHPGSFYALPQSPQIFKQLLMVAGVDRYYQVARCFRDEDLRADRQPEFTQVDMEMSFVDQEDILEHLEKLFRHIFECCMERPLARPFRRLTWQEAMDTYGSDKPDLRFDLPIVDLTDIAAGCGFSVFRRVCDRGGVVRAIRVPGGAAFTRSDIEDLTARALRYGAGGMAWILLREDGEINSILTKYFTKGEMQGILARTGAQNGDFILFCADQLSTVRRCLGGLRLDVAEKMGLRGEGEFQFAFVTDFPQFEYSAAEGRFIAMHHPFTMPYPEDIPYLTSDPGRVRAQAYDVVLNGIELGSGSIRIHREDIQKKMFAALGFTEEQIEQRFGFMVHAFQYGTPPHGGFAFGLDRLVMLLCGASSLREVIAFPKTKDAACPLTQAPGRVDAEQLETLGIALAGEAAPRQGGNAPKRPPLQVDKVAKLACLRFDEQEKAAIKKDLQDVIAFADSLAALDTAGVPPTAHVVPLQNVFREDVAGVQMDRDALLRNAPTRAEGYIAVPRVVE